LAVPLLTALFPELQQLQKGRDQPLSARALSRLLKRHFDDAADRQDDLIDVHQLRQTSTHWLRHTAATVMIKRGAQAAVVQEILGHSDSVTTALYTHADRKREAVEGMTPPGWGTRSMLRCGPLRCRNVAVYCGNYRHCAFYDNERQWRHEDLRRN
jgi:integrase